MCVYAYVPTTAIAAAAAAAAVAIAITIAIVIAAAAAAATAIATLFLLLFLSGKKPLVPLQQQLTHRGAVRAVVGFESGERLKLSTLDVDF